MGKPPHFFPEGLQKIESTFFSRVPRLLSLDFDGTLSEIATTPDAAFMSDLFRTALWKLTGLHSTRLLLLSGRSITDLKRKVRLPGAFYVGNHGLDFSPPSAGWGLQALKAWTQKSMVVRERLAPLVERWPGVLLENKGPDLSLHYRRLKPYQTRRLLPEALKAVQGLPVLARQGKCVLEFKPEDGPGKGEALKRVADRFFKSKSRGLCLHIGDDQTDEEAFKALRRMGRRAIGFKVGPGPTKAHYRLRNIPEVFRFLGLFLESNENSGR